MCMSTVNPHMHEMIGEDEYTKECNETDWALCVCVCLCVHV